MKDLKVKVCGMKSAEEIQQLVNTKLIDYVGFIFYPKSPRYCTEIPEFKGSIKRVGVFVNETIDVILEKVRQFQLTAIQLHGDETPDEVKEVSKKTKLPVFKAFGVDEKFDFSTCKAYEHHVNTFLFDTKTAAYGGSGEQFDWTVLKNYSGQKPFLLSGGLDEKALERLPTDELPMLMGVDLNSKFEFVPGKKDIKKIIESVKKIKNEN